MRILIFLLFCPCVVFSQFIERQSVGSFSNSSTTPFGTVQGSAGPLTLPPNADLGATSGMEQHFPQLKVEVQKQARGCAEGGTVFLVVEEMGECVQNLNVLIDGQEVHLGTLQLTEGSYDLKVTADFYCHWQEELIISELDLNTDCDLQFFTAVFPNGSVENSVWTISNIDRSRYEENEVFIYNRWGQQVWSAKGYNNRDVAFNGFSSEGKMLSSATYYYVVKAAGQTYQGYMEVLR